MRTILYPTRPALLFLLAALAALPFGGCGASADSGAGAPSQGEAAQHNSTSKRYDASSSQGMANPGPGGAMDMGAQGEAGSTKGNEGDSFDAPGTNPYVLADKDPLSTFAADVDTASYDIFRRDIGFGYLPKPESVRLEEFVNYFGYGDAAPDPEGKVPFKISTEAAASAYLAQTTLLRIGIKGRVPPKDAAPKRANLVFLIDVSGSMSGATKLPLVKKVLTETLVVLDPSDTISIVTYAGNTGVKLPPTLVSEKETIAAVIANFKSGGSTAGAAGITLAYQQAEKGFVKGGINHVLLCSDGDFNVGISSKQDLVKLIEDKRKTGITLTVLGFGTGNLNDAMMEAVSNAGNGIYGVISSADQAIDYVHERLLGTLVHIARDMKIQVEFNAKKVKAYRLLGYENRKLADNQFKDDTIDAGDVGEGHTVTALYELVLSGGAIPAPDKAPAVDDKGDYDGSKLEVADDELVRVKVRYKQPGASETDPAFEVFVGHKVSDVAASLDQASGALQWAAAVASFAEVLKGSPFRSAADLPTIDKAVKAFAGTDKDRVEFADLYGKASKLLVP